MFAEYQANFSICLFEAFIITEEAVCSCSAKYVFLNILRKNLSQDLFFHKYSCKSVTSAYSH